MNVNKFHINEYEKTSFTLFNSIVSINEKSDYDFKITGVSPTTNLNEIKELISLIYILSPDKMYQIIFPNNIVATPSTEHFGTINMVNFKITINPFYIDKFFSFCVYNDNPKYTIGAIKNCEQYKKTYPDHKILFYVRNDVPKEIKKEIINKGGIVIETLFIPDWFAMFTRFLPLEGAIFNSSRDTDCRLTNREMFVNQEFLLSLKKFHIIRDHPYHQTEILGGLWSSHNFTVPTLRLMILDFCTKNANKTKVPMGHDQNFLKNYIYPNIMKNHLLVHDNFFNYEKDKYIINLPRNNKEYLGEAYDENDNVDLKLRKVI